MSVTNAAGQDILPENVLNPEIEIVDLVITLAGDVKNATNAIDLVILRVNARRSLRDVIAVMVKAISLKIAHKVLMNLHVTIVINQVTLHVAVPNLGDLLLPHKFVTIVTKKDICLEIVQKEERRVMYVVNQAI